MEPTLTLSSPFDAEYDARGLICPMPVLKARKHLQSLDKGQVLKLRASDPAALIDVPHFCQESGYSFLGALDDSIDNPATQVYFIKKT